MKKTFLSKIIKKAISFVTACALLTVCAFAESDVPSAQSGPKSVSYTVKSKGVTFVETIYFTTNSSNRIFHATVSASDTCDIITSTVHVTKANDNSFNVSESWTENNATSCDAFYYASCIGVPDKLSASGSFYAEYNGKVILNEQNVKGVSE